MARADNATTGNKQEFDLELIRMANRLHYLSGNGARRRSAIAQITMLFTFVYSGW